jgi:hypothetical protein
MATVSSSQLDPTNGQPVIESSTADVVVGAGTADNVLLTGNANINATGDAHANILVGNDGNNQLHGGDGNDLILSGDGNDMIMLGAGDDTVYINGSGTKTVNGGPQTTAEKGQFTGEGNDSFFILPDSDGPSHTTFSGLNIGDRLTVTVPDSNGDGVLDLSDVTLSGSNTPGAQSLTIELSNGTTFTLEDVPVAAASNGTIAYDVIDNHDGTWCVELTGVVE